MKNKFRSNNAENNLGVFYNLKLLHGTSVYELSTFTAYF